MVAELGRGRPVFDLVGPVTPWGPTWAWVQEDIDFDSVGRARTQLWRMFAAEGCPHRLLVHLGAERFVDLRGMRLLLDVAAELARGGGALAVVAPPRCLTRMATVFALQQELPMVETVHGAASWARTRTEA